MTRRLAKALGASSFGIAVLLTLFTIPAAFGADLVKGNIPFAFQAGKKTLPAGEYEIRIDRQEGTVMIRSEAPKGPEVMEVIVTYLAMPAHSNAPDADLVFDKIDGAYILSEVWFPGADGVVLHLTKEPHAHRVHHVKL